MASDDNKVTNAPVREPPLRELAKKFGTLPEKFDLDKNPIKFKQWDGSLSEKAHDKDYMELTLRSGKHSDLVRKLLRQKIEARANEFPRWPADNYGAGVRVMWLESRYWYDRERLLQPHFDDDWRKYRSRYLHSLELHPEEPYYDVPNYHKALINPIRRFYMKIGDVLESRVIQKFTNDRHTSATVRACMTRPWLAYFAVILIWYRLRYMERTWEENGGQTVYRCKGASYPGDPNWLMQHRANHWHHLDEGFLSRNVYQDLRDYEDTTVVL